jgi:hypothetical protein
MPQSFLCATPCESAVAAALCRRTPKRFATFVQIKTRLKLLPAALDFRFLW